MTEHHRRAIVEPVADRLLGRQQRRACGNRLGATIYKNCTAVRAAGADPIRRGDAGYARHLDRDGDGVGCE